MNHRETDCAAALLALARSLGLDEGVCDDPSRTLEAVGKASAALPPSLEEILAAVLAGAGDANDPGADR